MVLTNNQKLLLGNGGLWAMYEGLTSAFLIAYALHLGASNTIIGLLGAIPFVGAVIGEMPGVLLMRRWSRLGIYLATTTIDRLSWAGMLLIPFLAAADPLVWLVVIYAVGRLMIALSDPSWTSLAADVVSEKLRGTYFSRRLFVIGVLSMMAFLAGGFILDLFPKDSHAGFVIIFTTGIVLGLLATGIMARVREPRIRSHEIHSFKDFTREWHGDFGWFLLFSCVFNFAYMLSSPFFTAYMLNDLKMSYSLFVIANALSFIAKVFSQSAFGPMTDRVGDKPVAMACVFGTGVIPLMFLFLHTGNLWILIPAQIISGIVWAGIELTTFNLLLDMSDRDDRPFQVAEFNVITSIPLVIAPIVGGFLADTASVVGLAGIPLVFAVSMILRFLSAGLLIRLPERRGPAHVPAWIVVREFLGVFSAKGAHRQVVSVKKWMSVR